MINWHFFQRVFLLKFVLKANKDDYYSDSKHLPILQNFVLTIYRNLSIQFVYVSCMEKFSNNLLTWYVNR